jgi:hypothetical protein
MREVPTTGFGLRATLVAVIVLATATTAAGADSGGVGPGSGNNGGGDSGGGHRDCQPGQFGQRSLERGDCGNDVETLNWLLRADDFRVALDPSFSVDTQDAVRALQRRRDIKRDGVVGRETREAIVAGMSRHKASWYGPGFYGNHTACGQVLRRGTVGVAHRHLPCGTKVTFRHGGRYARTKVIDRGPFVKQARYERDWDLTAALADRLGFQGVDHVRSAPIR